METINWRNTRPITDTPSLLRRLRDAIRFEDGEPRSLIDSWPFLVSFGIVVIILYVARAWGWI